MRPGTTIDDGAAFVGDGVAEGPNAGVEVTVVEIEGSGVASETAVPKTPDSVASPSAAACEIEEILGESVLIPSTGLVQDVCLEPDHSRLFVRALINCCLIEHSVDQLYHYISPRG